MKVVKAKPIFAKHHSTVDEAKELLPQKELLTTAVIKQDYKMAAISCLLQLPILAKK